MIARRLEAERRTPTPSFRGALRRALVSQGDRRLGERSRSRSRAVALGCFAMGFGLLAFAAAGLADVGPLAPNDVLDAVAYLHGR
jgi:hypothetical protein